MLCPENYLCLMPNPIVILLLLAPAVVLSPEHRLIYEGCMFAGKLSPASALLVPGWVEEVAPEPAVPSCVLQPKLRGDARRSWPAKCAPSLSNRLHRLCNQGPF